MCGACDPVRATPSCAVVPVVATRLVASRRLSGFPAASSLGTRRPRPTCGDFCGGFAGAVTIGGRRYVSGDGRAGGTHGGPGDDAGRRLRGAGPVEARTRTGTEHGAR